MPQAAPLRPRRRLARALPERLPILAPGAVVELMGGEEEGGLFTARLPSYLDLS